MLSHSLISNVERNGLVLNLSCSLSDKDYPKWVYNPGLLRKVDSSDKNDHSGAGRVFRAQSGERGPTGACGLLLWKHPLPSFHQVPQERGQEEGGRRHGATAGGSGKWRGVIERYGRKGGRLM